MPSLKPTKSGGWSARQRIPGDVAEEYKRLYGQKLEAKLFIAVGTPPGEARQLHAEWIAEHEGRVKAIRAHKGGKGLSLTDREARALAGRWYNQWVARYEDAAGSAERWDVALWNLIGAMEDYAPDHVRQNAWSDLEWTRDPQVRAGIRPRLADLGHTAQFLGNEGIALTPEAMNKFLDSVLDNYIEGLALLASRARGDYSRDELPDSFPEFKPQKPQGASGVSPWELFERWTSGRQPKQSSLESWRTVFSAMGKHFSRCSADAITPEQAQEWIDGLVTEQRSAFTVRNTWLRAVNAIYRWAKKRKLVRTNPFAEVTVDVPKRRRTRPKWFYDDEYKAILRAAHEISDTSNPDNAARRWVPWLQAYSGARPGEITQLRAEDVRCVEGVWTINLTPEAGSIKTDEARLVPLHDHLLEQGFLDFVTRKGKGPLFYRPRRIQNTADPTKQKKTPGAQTRQRLASWVRLEVGVTSKALAPNHAWRHTFKLLGDRAGIPEKTLDYICGHAPATEGRGYGVPALQDMAAALQKFPRYSLEPPKGT